MKQKPVVAKSPSNSNDSRFAGGIGPNTVRPESTRLGNDVALQILSGIPVEKIDFCCSGERNESGLVRILRSCFCISPVWDCGRWCFADRPEPRA
ncbi:hypothetical protein AVEN_173344-1 [Araneus ventricosus]|uniref:Uncharacterized protein n=1 Tax=Araneus ventricosus TaxID=182803 RepID=A0A4Y2IBE2_ARAVE|nr:hypothetical protein AVEN_173344-1 [Araneus ventricosus]